MMVDTTIYGYYVPDLGPICTDCVVIDDETNEPENDAQALFSHDDTENEATICDLCGSIIFEEDADGILQQLVEDELTYGRQRVPPTPDWLAAQNIIDIVTEHIEERS